MDLDKEKLLLEQFPDLCSNYHLAATQSCFSFGFECNNGWFDIIQDALNKLNQLREKYTDLKIAQIKEKFGTLRIYLDLHSPEADIIIYEAEIKSKTTCECCGSLEAKCTGKLWYQTLCFPCYEKRYQ